MYTFFSIPIATTHALAFSRQDFPNNLQIIVPVSSGDACSVKFFKKFILILSQPVND